MTVKSGLFCGLLPDDHLEPGAVAGGLSADQNQGQRWRGFNSAFVEYAEPMLIDGLFDGLETGERLHFRTNSQPKIWLMYPHLNLSPFPVSPELHFSP